MPISNIGFACGRGAGPYVIDIDVDKGEGIDGFKSIKEFPVLPDTVAQDTPRGGFHAFYRTDDPPANKNSFRPGIDIRGDGYYVLLAPSIHPNGKEYKWAPGYSPWECKLAEWPEFLRPPKRKSPVAPPPQSPRLDPTGVSSDVKMQIAEAYLPKCDLAVQGQGGHDKLFWAAQCMVNGIGLSDGEAYDILARLYNPFCIPPWDLSDAKDEKDFRRKITEARKNPPRDLPYLWILNNPEYAHLREPVSQAVRDGAAKMVADFIAEEQSTGQAESRAADGETDAAIEQSAQPQVAEEWPEITPLYRLPEVPSFHPLFLPDAIRPWIEDIADRTQAPIDYPAVASIVGMASVVGRQLTIRPKRCDDWSVVPNLWGILVGLPAIMKTPSLQAALAPVRRLEVVAKDEYVKAMTEWEQKAVVRKEKAKLQRKEINKALESGKGDTEKLLAAMKTADEEKTPSRRRFLLNDATTEKVGEILRDNPIGLLLVRDELIGLLRGLDRSGREQDRAFYLEAWNGKHRFTYDRIGRGTLDIDALCISIIGCTQPGPWEMYVREAVTGGRGADGLTPRFQLAVWPESSKQWQNVDRWPDSDARKRASEVFDSLHNLPVGIGQQDEFDDLAYVRFSPDAQEMFDEWRDKLEHRLRSGRLDEAMESHLAKYRSLIPTLALVSSLADGHYGDIPLTYIDRAIRMGAYLESHARKLYSSVAVSKGVKAATALLSRIKNGELKDGFTVRDVYRKGWSGLSDSGDAKKAVGVLVEHGYLVSRTVRTGGKSRTEYRVNPATFSEVAHH